MNRNEIATYISAAGISQSLARAEIEKANALYDEFAQHFWPIIGSANQMAYIAMDEAVDALKEAAKFQRQTPVRIADNFKAGRITACESHWRLVGYFTGRTDLADVDLRNDPQCQLAVQVILTRYQAADFLNDAAKEALELNPDVERKYCKQ